MLMLGEKNYQCANVHLLKNEKCVHHFKIFIFNTHIDYLKKKISLRASKKHHGLKIN